MDVLLMAVAVLTTPDEAPRYPLYIERSDAATARIYSTASYERWCARLVELEEGGWPAVTWHSGWHFEGGPDRATGRQVRAGVSLHGLVRWLFRKLDTPRPDIFTKRGHMPSTVDIGVFCIGRTMVDKEEVRRWLDFVGADEFSIPEDGAISNPALLIALAGKRCFDPETEVLTDRGWLPFADLDRSERVMTLNPLTNQCEWQQPYGYYVGEHVGSMCSVEGRDISMLVTPDHRVYGKPKSLVSRPNYFVTAASLLNGQTFRIPTAGGSWAGQCPDEVEVPEFCFKQQSANQHGHFGAHTRIATFTFSSSKLRDLALLLTYHVAEGSYGGSGERKKYVQISGHHQDEVRHLCINLGLKCSLKIDHRNGCPMIRVGGGEPLARYFHESCGHLAPEKRLPRWVLELPPADLAEVWRVLVLTDGTVTQKGQETLSTTSAVLAGQVQEILLKLGSWGSLHKIEPQPEQEGRITSKRLAYRVGRKSRPDVLVNRKDVQLREVPYAGPVYCVSVPNGIIAVRRRQSMYWSGNCYKSFQKSLNPNVTKIREDYAEYFDNILKSGHGSVLEHSVYNFAFENVSRVFSAEMNRHRAGWAISEGSLRFIRFGDNIPYWEPDSIKGPDVLGDDKLRLDHMYGELHELLYRINNRHPDSALNAILSTLDGKKQFTRAVFHAAFQNQQDWYKVMEAIWKEELAPTSKFAGKKEITSLMRRIVGLGVATGGVWSGNIRGLRHVITMRAAPEAEEEILHVFTRVAKFITEREPLLFGDFHQDEQGYWRPRYRKV